VNAVPFKINVSIDRSMELDPLIIKRITRPNQTMAAGTIEITSSNAHITYFFIDPSLPFKVLFAFSHYTGRNEARSIFAFIVVKYC
jgi:hypothetical protein